MWWTCGSTRTQTIAAPEGASFTSLRWYSDSRYVLLDMVQPAADGASEQVWARAAPDEPPPWTESAPSRERDNLFDYQPLGSGVFYTLLPVDGVWALYHLPDLSGALPPTAIALDMIAQEGGTPVILHIP